MITRYDPDYALQQMSEAEAGVYVRAADHETIVNEQSAQIANLTERLNAANAQLSTATSLISDLQNDIGQANADRDQAFSDRDVAQNTLNERDTEAANLRQQNASLSAQSAEVNKQLTDTLVAMNTMRQNGRNALAAVQRFLQEN